MMTSAESSPSHLFADQNCGYFSFNINQMQKQSTSKNDQSTLPFDSNSTLQNPQSQNLSNCYFFNNHDLPTITASPSSSASSSSTVSSSSSSSSTTTKFKPKPPNLKIPDLKFSNDKKLKSSQHKSSNCSNTYNISSLDIHSLLNIEEFESIVRSSSPEDLVIIDLRPFSSYSKSRIKDALNIATSTLMLKRNVSDLSDIINKMNHPYRISLKHKLDNSQNLKIIFYDSNSSTKYCSFQFYHIVKLFHDNIKKYSQTFKLYIIHKGFLAFTSSKEAELKYIDSTVIEKSKTPDQPCFSEFLLPAKDTSDSFLMSMKSNQLSLDSSIRFNDATIKIPNFSFQEVKKLPLWLQQFTDPKCIDSLISKFTKIEHCENQRISASVKSFNHNNVVLTPSLGFNGISNHNQYDRKYDNNYHNNYYNDFSNNSIKHNNNNNNNNNTTNNLPSTSLATPLPMSHKRSSSKCDSIDSNPKSPRSPNPSSYLLSGPEKGYKNRYPNILPYEHSRVRLVPSPLPSASSPPIKGPENGFFFPVEDNPESSSSSLVSNISQTQSNRLSVSPISSNCNSEILSPSPISCSAIAPTTTCKSDITPSLDDYFNGNTIHVPQINEQSHYIATQAPLPSTIDDFWRVVWHNNAQVIISLTNLSEYGVRKSDIYWHESSQVKLVEEIHNYSGLSGLTVRKIRLTRHSHKKTVYQLHYSDWPDQGSEDPLTIIRLIQIKNTFITNPKAPVVVHCSAGCGRTGTFIAIDLILQAFKILKETGKQVTELWRSSEDLINLTVQQIRKQRIFMVQSLAQFVGCYETVLFYFSREHTIAL